MKLIITKDYDELSKEAFKVMKNVIEQNPKAVLGLATGSSPIGLYDNMIEDHRKNGTSYKGVTTYNLDEYVGINRNDPQSYYTFMNDHLFKGIDILFENTHVPYGDTQEDADEYDQQVKGVDIQLLGIGNNGHIGFNEPGTPFNERTHIVQLTPSTREANKRFFEGDINKVPTHAITQGIGTVMDAKKILLIASGKAKADAVKAMVEGPVNEQCPASILQNHPDAIVIVDEEAASKLTK